MTSAVGLMCFNISSYSKSSFELIHNHLIIIYVCFVMNVINVLCNYYLFGMSFNDYFEYKESLDYDEMMDDLIGDKKHR